LLEITPDFGPSSRPIRRCIPGCVPVDETRRISRSNFSGRPPMLVGSADFGVVGRAELLRTGLRRATEGTAIIAAQLTGVTLLAGVFFRKIEALRRFKYFSFNTWNDNKSQRAFLTVAVSMVFQLESKHHRPRFNSAAIQVGRHRSGPVGPDQSINSPITAHSRPKGRYPA